MDENLVVAPFCSARSLYPLYRVQRHAVHTKRVAEHDRNDGAEVESETDACAAAEDEGPISRCAMFVAAVTVCATAGSGRIIPF